MLLSKTWWSTYPRTGLTRSDLLQPVQTIGIQYTTAPKSGFLTSTYVVLIPFVYWLLRKKIPGVRVLISAAICIMRIAFISLDGNLKMNKGDLLTILAAVLFTGSIIGFVLIFAAVIVNETG